MNYLNERIDLNRLCYLKQETQQIISVYFGKEKNKVEREKWIQKYSNFVIENLKNNGNRIIHYDTPATSIEAFGSRLFAHKGIQSVPADIRGFLVNGYTTDIDAKNCHPVILKYVCNKHHIPCPTLSEYIDNRDSILSNNFKSKDEGKHKIIISMNDEQPVKSQNTWFKKFDSEMKYIQQSLCLIPEYHSLYQSIPSECDSNKRGSLLNRICCSIENKMIGYVCEFMANNKIEVFAKCFDGILVYGDHYQNQQLLSDIAEYVESKMPNLNIQWAYKPHSNTIQMPENYTPPSIPSLLGEDILFTPEYLSWKAGFEAEWCKIRNTSTFVKRQYDLNGNFHSFVFKTKSDLITAYEEFSFTVIDQFNKPKKYKCITTWLSDPSLRTYEYAQVIPPPLVCPANVFNLWNPFKYLNQPIEETHADYDSNFVELFETHLRIMCNHDDNVFNYVLNWISHAFQFPAIKPESALTFVGGQGAGKSTLSQVIGELMGAGKKYESSRPERDVWGNFNAPMLSAYLVILTEFDRNSYGLAGERELKKLITDGATDEGMTISQKGKDSFTVNSFHRIWMDSNTLDCVNTSADDRRNVIVNVSDEMKGNTQYFETFYTAFKRPHATRSLFWYLYRRDISQWNPRDIVRTQFHEIIIESRVNPIVDFITTFVNKYHEEDSYQTTVPDLLEDFLQWRRSMNIKFGENMNGLSLLKQIKLSKAFPLDCLTTRRSRFCNFQVFDIRRIREHLGMDAINDLS